MGNQVPSLHTVANVFSPEECDRILRIGLSEVLVPAYAAGMIIDPDRRRSMIRFMYSNTRKEWIFDRLWNILRTENLDDGITTLNFLQFTEYKAEYGGHFGIHSDTENFYHPTDTLKLERKVSCVIQLSDPCTYKGGNVEFPRFFGDEPVTGQRDRGCAILFPSNTLHRVTKVTKGERYSLVAWFEGPK